MNKPSGYDEAQAAGEFVPVDLGGHYAAIKQVTEMKSSTGKDMIVVLFDFIKPDKQNGYFSDQYDADTRDDAKWPFAGSKYILVQDFNDPKKTSRNFKTFCSCVEKSNGYSIQWGGDAWAKQFRGKKIGVVYGEEEHEYDGRTTMRRVPKWFCELDKVSTSTIPAPKYLPKTAPSSDSDFVNVPDGAEDEIPF